MEKIICGIQQVGIGIPDEDEAFAWYRKAFGVDVPIFQDAAEAPHMTPYTGDKVQSRSATLALNMQGGGGFEIWQYTSREPQPADFDVQLGDTGIFAPRIKSRDVAESYRELKAMGADLLGEITEGPGEQKHFFLKDPYGYTFQVVEGQSWFSRGDHHTGGVAGCMLGVSDVEESLTLYRDILGYDTVVYDEEGTFDDLGVLDGGSGTFRRVLISHSKPRTGTFSRLVGASKIELIQSLDRSPKKIFKDRYWGDLGFIHLCFDVKGIDKLEQECIAAGFPFTVNSKESFDMGEAAGQFSYIEDPDGTLIEFVETHRIPIWKKVGWYLNVNKKRPEKPLPDWMLKFLKLSRVKN